MEADLIIRHASELITREGLGEPLRKELIGALGVIENASVVINEEKILKVGKDEEISEEITAKREIDATDQIVLPGFIDAHTHLVFGGSRENELSLKVKGFSYMQIAQRGGGIQKTVKQTRNATKEELKTAARARLDEMLRHGTTTIEAKSGYGLNTKQEIKLLEVINELDKEHPIDVIPTFLGAHEVPPQYKKNPEEYIDTIIEEMIPKIAKKDLAKFCDVFLEKGVFNKKQAARILRAGKKHGLVPRIHTDEFTQSGGAEVAVDVGAISASHLLKTSKRDLKNLAENSIIGIYLPAACMSLFSERFPDGRESIDSGLPIALATDFNPSCWLTNMQTVIMLAIYFMNITPAETVSATTLNPAYSLGIENKVGSIEKGKKADLILIDIPNHRWLGYKFGTNIVNTVIKDGQIAWRRNSEKR